MVSSVKSRCICQPRKFVIPDWITSHKPVKCIPLSENNRISSNDRPSIYSANRQIKKNYRSRQPIRNYSDYDNLTDEQLDQEIEFYRKANAELKKILKEVNEELERQNTFAQNDNNEKSV